MPRRCAAHEVFAAAGANFTALQRQADRGHAIAAAARGTAKIALDLHARGQLDGVIGLGGSAGTTIATAAMRVLPFGLPKLMVSTLASGQVRPYVGVRDILMMHSVVDISGLNRISRRVLTNAAHAMIGMVLGRTRCPTAETVSPWSHEPSSFHLAPPCSASRLLASRRLPASHRAAGYEVLVFHATGSGGQTMEAFIGDGLICGVLDLTTTELADELVGGTLDGWAGSPDGGGVARHTPRSFRSGALDMVNFGPPETVRKSFTAAASISTIRR